eukprot:COSAG01_NODE_3631_length_5847_cov_18.156228_3_plen_109_part_00
MRHSWGAQRTKEGLFIHELATLVNGGGSSASGGGTDAESIKATIQHLVEVMARDHHLNEEQQQILRLYVHRAVFPLIAPACFYLASEDARSDEEYIRYRDTGVFQIHK